MSSKTSKLQDDEHSEIEASNREVEEQILFDFLPPINNLNENLSTTTDNGILKAEIDDIFGSFAIAKGAEIKTSQFDDIISLEDDGLNIDLEISKLNLGCDKAVDNDQAPGSKKEKSKSANLKDSNSPSHKGNNYTQSASYNNYQADYNRSYFESTLRDNNKPKSSSDIFGDILGEQGYKFESKLNQGSKSINEMRKGELIREMDPDKLKIFNWTDGKKNNIRALLCSMHTILWDNAKWSKCEMHQLISPSDVKKAYRKGCLAVHPDKQVGTSNENIAKMMFMELNNAWSEFEKDGLQQKIMS